MKYRGRKTVKIRFPVGGIGTGSIGLSGNGMLVDWEIMNRPKKNSNNGLSFFAVKAEKDGKVLDARVLNGDYRGEYYGASTADYNGFGNGADRASMAGMPHFKDSVFDGSFPYARISFADERFPGRPALTAFNPMIPSNEDDSSLPAAFFCLEVTNTSKTVLDYIFSANVMNPFGPGYNEKVQSGALTGISFRDTVTERTQIYNGDLCLMTDAGDCSVQEYWYRGVGGFDNLEMFWENYTAPGHLKERRYVDEKGNPQPSYGDIGSISARVRVQPGKTGRVRFVIGWYFPICENFWNPLPEEKVTDTLKNTWKNYYATKFSSSVEVATYCLKNYDRLDRETRLFHDALFSTTVPDYVLDAVSSTMSVLKTTTTLRLENGYFYGFEGSQTSVGSCEGSCTHVWNYAYALPFLFPRLERTLRQTSYEYNMDPAGGVRFRTMLPLGREYLAFRPCADGQFGDIMKVYREWKISGDTEWLRKYWPCVKKELEYAWNPGNPDRWDPNKDGVLEGRQHHTLDLEMFGPSGWLNGMYLGALKAGSAMAQAMGEPDKAEEYKKIYESGRAWVEKNLFNGEYFIQKVDFSDREMLASYCEAERDSEAWNDKRANPYFFYWNEESGELAYQIGEGCSIDQVNGQWHANLVGLGEILDKEKVRSALQSIYQYNFRCMRDHVNPCRFFSLNDEKGTVICSWPKHVRKPALPIYYAQETMFGFEYQAAVGMLQNGLIKEGLELIRSVRERHNGENRNPWNEMECGSNYARSMASYSALLALSGFTFDMTIPYIGFEPLLSQDSFKTFWSVDGAWGTYEQKNGKAVLRVLYGSLPLKMFHAGNIRPGKVLFGKKEQDFATGNGCLVLKDRIRIGAGEKLTILP